MATIGPENRERIARRDEPISAGSHELEHERETTAKAVATGSTAEAVCSAGAVVLSILGLAGVFPAYMAPIATISLGAALLAQGASIASRYRHPRVELEGGMSAEFLGGAAGVVLGILGLIGIATATLIPIAVVVFGASLLLGGGVPAELGTFGFQSAQDRAAHLARQASVAASGTQMLVGIGAVVLGILALVGVDPGILTLVGLLALGGAALLSGTAVTTRMMTVLHR